MAGRTKALPKAEKTLPANPVAQGKASSDRFDEATLAGMRSWEIGAAATALDQRVRTIGRQHQEDFTELGLIIREVESRELWKYIVSNDGETMCHSLDQWMHEALPWSNGTAYSALGVARDCADIPVEDRKQIPRGNLETLRKVSPAVRRDPQVIKRAKETQPEAFVRELATEHPYEHLEGKLKYRFSPTESQRKFIDECIIVCMDRGDALTREDALECFARTYIQNLEHTEQPNVIKVAAGTVQ